MKTFVRRVAATVLTTGLLLGVGSFGAQAQALDDTGWGHIASTNTDSSE